MNYKQRLVYVLLVILTMVLFLGLTHKVVEAYWYDWLLGGTREVVVELPIVYKYGDTIPIEHIREIISQYATSTKAYEIERTIWCESFNKNIQSYIIDKHGNREDSWGIAQINLYWNPSVTKEQALDPEFAIKWMSDRWGKTKWYGWIRKTDSCNSIYR